MTKKKEEFEETKKTVEAHGEFSEEEALKKAENAEEVTEELLDKKIIDEETIKSEKEPEEEIEKVPIRAVERGEGAAKWEPKTKLGKEVRSEKVKNIDEILESDRKILEPEIADYLLSLKFDLLNIGQSKGKFGGGKRRAWRQTQRKTKEGNVPTFSTMAVVGDEQGHVGIGYGRAKETLPARDKAIRQAKLNVIKVERNCSGFDCSCNEPHTIPFKVNGRAGSVRVSLIPAPQGTGLVVGNELKKVLKLAGIKDVYSKTKGQRRTTFNLVKACIDALRKTNRERVK